MSLTLNQVVEELADLIATKVVEKQQTQDWPKLDDKPAWPAVEPKETPTMDEAVGKVAEEISQKAAQTPPEPAVESVDPRVEELQRVNIRSLRRDMAAAEGKGPDDYTHLNKAELVKLIVDFEHLIGRTIQEEIDKKLKDSGLKVGETVPADDDYESDTEVDVVEPESDEDAELTREKALEIGRTSPDGLADLKAIAVNNDVDPSELTGLDVEAIVDLLFGASDDEPAEDDEETVTLSIEDVEAMSMAELKGIADECGLEYHRSITQVDLCAKLVELLS